MATPSRCVSTLVRVPRRMDGIIATFIPVLGYQSRLFDVAKNRVQQYLQYAAFSCAKGGLGFWTVFFGVFITIGQYLHKKK